MRNVNTLTQSWLSNLSAEQFLERQEIQLNNRLLTQWLDKAESITSSAIAQRSVFQSLGWPSMSACAVKSSHTNPSNRSSSCPASKGLTYRLTLPCWLWSKTLEITLERQKASIGLRIRYHNIVDWHSEGMRAVMDHDLEYLNTFSKLEEQVLSMFASAMDFLY